MSIVSDLFSKPKITGPTPPPNTPRRPDSGLDIGTPTNFQSLISTGSTSGLKRKASTQKRSLIGGS